MKFRKTFTNSFIISSKKRLINRRTILSVASTTTVRPMLLVDLDYFEHILLRYIEHPNSKLKNLVNKNLILTLAGNKISKDIQTAKELLRVKQKVLEIYSSLLKTILPEKISLFSTKDSSTISYILYILEPLGLPKIKHKCTNTHSFVFNFLNSFTDTNPIYLFSNDISSWMFSDIENKYNLCFTILSKNNQCVSFNNKTCGDLICKILNSTKPNHKLGFDILKNISFQYLFFLFLGLKFFYKKSSADQEFYLDSKYFRKIKKLGPHDKFLRASGKGLEYLHRMHKNFYFMLKHNNFMMYFLYANQEDLDFYLDSNSTIQYQDKFLLKNLKNFYDTTEKITKESILIPDLKINQIKTNLLDYWYSDSFTLSYFCHKQTESFLTLPDNPLFNKTLFYHSVRKIIFLYRRFPVKFQACLSKQQISKYLYLYKKIHANNLMEHTKKFSKDTKQEMKLSDIRIGTDEELFVDSLIYSYLL